MNSQIALEKKVEINRDLLIAALNKNQVSFAQIAKSAESISSGSLKLKLDSGGKVFVFEYLDKKVVLELNGLRLKGLKYLNDILIDDILTKGELDEVYRILEQVQEELLNKADKEHTHEISDVNGLEEKLNDIVGTGLLNIKSMLPYDNLKKQYIGTIGEPTLGGYSYEFILNYKGDLFYVPRSFDGVFYITNSNYQLMIKIKYDLLTGVEGFTVMNETGGNKLKTKSLMLADYSDDWGQTNEILYFTVDLSDANDFNLYEVYTVGVQNNNEQSFISICYTGNKLTNVREYLPPSKELDNKADKDHTHEVFNNDVQFNGTITSANVSATNETRLKACEDKLSNIQDMKLLYSNDSTIDAINNMIKQTPTGNIAIGYCNANPYGDFAYNTFLTVHPSGSPRTFALAVPKNYSGYIQLQQQSSPDGSAYENINWYKIPVCDGNGNLSVPGSLTVNGNLNGHDIRLMSALKLLLQNSTPMFSNRSQCQEYKNLVYQLGLTPFAGSPQEVWVGDFRCYI